MSGQNYMNHQLDLERVLARIEAAMPAPDGRVERLAQWQAEDGWIIGWRANDAAEAIRGHQPPHLQRR